LRKNKATLDTDWGEIKPGFGFSMVPTAQGFNNFFGIFIWCQGGQNGLPQNQSKSGVMERAWFLRQTILPTLTPNENTKKVVETLGSWNHRKAKSGLYFPSIRVQSMFFLNFFLKTLFFDLKKYPFLRRIQNKSMQNR